MGVDGRCHKLAAGFMSTSIPPFLDHLSAKPASSFCHGSAWIGRRDEREAYLLRSKATRGRNLMVVCVHL